MTRSPADALSALPSAIGFAPSRTAKAGGPAVPGDLDPRLGARLIGLGLMLASGALTVTGLYCAWHFVAGQLLG